MELRTNKESFFRKVWDDPVLRFFPLLFVIVHIPYFLPAINIEQHEIYVGRYHHGSCFRLQF